MQKIEKTISHRNLLSFFKKRRYSIYYVSNVGITVGELVKAASYFNIKTITIWNTSDYIKASDLNGNEILEPIYTGDNKFLHATNCKKDCYVNKYILWENKQDIELIIVYDEQSKDIIDN